VDICHIENREGQNEMIAEGKKRVVIERVHPEIDCGQFPIKRVVGERVVIQAGIFTDGHDEIAAALRYRKADEKTWRETPMKPLGNDRWEAEFTVEEIGLYFYTIQAWVDHFQTWRKDLRKRVEAGQDVKVELLIGAEYVDMAVERAPVTTRERLQACAKTLRYEKEIEKAISLALSKDLADMVTASLGKIHATDYPKELPIRVDGQRALFSAWYEIFPRSYAQQPGWHGTFKDCERLLPDIARLGFDVIYLPPIHPIGNTKRKGKNNSPVAEAGDVGSPWAIGSEHGGHKAVAPELGTLQDFERFVSRAKEHSLEVAIDLAYQASPDHPYVKERPEWFRWRPDGTVQYAENPPKKYQDVLPFYFETEHWQSLWEELKSVVQFWIDRGVRVFRVDNPHTKPISFWEWMIGEIKRDHPDVIFLSEAFTRPKVMYRLAKVGFTQSYTYFTWRNTKQEIIEYLTELTRTEAREYFRPNFWPNTPDILPEFLQYGGRPAFIIRLILAATLSSNYGMYGAAYDLCVNEAVPGKEEYLHSEKYELKRWDVNQPGHLRSLIARMNRIRRENPALQTTWNLNFHEVDNDQILFFSKASDDLSNLLLIAVNLDPFHPHSGYVQVPLDEFGIDPKQSYLAHDLLSDDKFIWQGERNYVSLDPHAMPAHIFRIHRRMRREADFDYYM
jgi:starch synthase (maltosyl-transferring)